MKIADHKSQVELATKVIAFVAQWPHGTKIPITTQTSLRNDLGLYGDDAWDLLVAFVKQFGVDGQTLRFTDHFEQEGLTLPELGCSRLRELRVSDLIDAARAGKFTIDYQNATQIYKQKNWKELFHDAFGCLGLGKKK